MEAASRVREMPCVQLRSPPRRPRLFPELVCEERGDGLIPADHATRVGTDLAPGTCKTGGDGVGRTQCTSAHQRWTPTSRQAWRARLRACAPPEGSRCACSAASIPAHDLLPGNASPRALHQTADLHSFQRPSPPARHRPPRRQRCRTNAAVADVMIFVGRPRVTQVAQGSPGSPWGSSPVASGTPRGAGASTRFLSGAE